MIYTMTLNPAVDRELTVSELTFNQVLRATRTQVDCGGKGFNVSRMLAQLEAVSTALGFAGGYSGQLLQEELNRLEIETDFIWIPSETRTNVSIVVEGQPGTLKVNESGPPIPEVCQSALLEQISQLAQPGDWWVLAGSLPPQVPSDFYASCIRLIQAAGGQALLDTSGAALGAGCVAKPFLIKPNDSEIQALTQLPVETSAQRLAAAEAVRALGAQHVVVSLGKEGGLLVSPHGRWHVTAPQITEQNPIGAGDSMVGGIVWGLSQGLAVEDALRWGIACGAGSASLRGTAVASRQLVESLFEYAHIQPL